jgi:protein-tyrosine phosphatase
MDLDLYAIYLRRGHGWSPEEAADLKRRVRNALRRKLPE